MSGLRNSMRRFLSIAFWGCALGARKPVSFTELEIGANQMANQSARARNMVGNLLRNRFELHELLHSDEDELYAPPYMKHVYPPVQVRPPVQVPAVRGPYVAMPHYHAVPVPYAAVPKHPVGIFPWGNANSTLSSALDKQPAPEELGKGSFGDTWKASDKKTGNLVAVKIFYKGDEYITKAMVAQYPELRAAVERNNDECKLIQRMTESSADPEGKEHICQCIEPHALDMVAQDDVSFLVLEHCGATMLTRMLESPGDLARVRKWMRGTLQGIEFMSSLSPPMLHMDLKLENVVVTDEDEAKIIDFGACIKVSETPKTCTTHLAAPEFPCNPNRPDLGPIYAYPEHYAWAYDVWTAGAMYYNLLCKNAFNTDRIQQRLALQQHLNACEDGTQGFGEDMDWQVVAGALQYFFAARTSPSNLLAVMFQMPS